jgi:UTP--glucose-1-phosphate uridylyltransferase
MNKIRKAILPVAGLGTRFLPATKAHPKEMLPIVDKPLIQFAAEEAANAGISQLIFITNHSKRAIEDHFSTNFELEHRLRERDEQERLAVVQNILPDGVTCIYIRQHQPLGLGHAILCAQELIGDEAFAVLLADDYIATDGPGCLRQMLDFYQHQPSNILAVTQVPSTEAHRYGITEVAPSKTPHPQVNRIIEKPAPGHAPSNLAVVGRYILQPSIFKHLTTTPVGKNGEIQLTDAIAKQLEDENVHAFEFSGQRYDCGDKFGYLEATLQYGLRHPEIKQQVRDLIQALQLETTP